MGISIKKVNELPPESLIQFLEEQQGTPADHTRWKYFDSEFNAGRLRGFAAMQDSRVVGMLGLIPFTASLNNETFDTAWTCDWFVDAERASGATGIALLKAATAACDKLYHTGGGDVTKQLFGRLANVTEEAAIKEYRMLLRLGYLINRAKVRSPWLAKLPLNIGNNIPLRRKKAPIREIDSLFSPGVSETLVRTFGETPMEADFHPIYDARYINWFSRNPGLEFYSYTFEQKASALLWHPRKAHPHQTKTEWRLALAPGTASPDELSALADVAADFATVKGADSLKVLVSGRDVSLCAALEKSGYTERRQQPFFAFYHDPASMPSESMSGHSFLDADNATLY